MPAKTPAQLQREIDAVLAKPVPAVATRIAKASRRPSGNGGRSHSTKKSSAGPSSLWTVIGLYDNGQRAAYVVRSPNAVLAEQQALSQADTGFEVAGVVKGSVQLHDADSGVAAAKRDDGHKPRMYSWTVLGLYDNETELRIAATDEAIRRIERIALTNERIEG